MSVNILRFLFFSILILKICVFVFIYFNDYSYMLGGGNDSNYYHNYAIGLDDLDVNIWPVILRFLNSYGAYSRDGVSVFLKFLGFLCVPLLVAKVSVVNNSPSKVKIYWLVAIILSLYPSIVLFTLDIYRDVFMVFLFIFGVFLFKIMSSNGSSFLKIFLFFVALYLSYLLYEFRPYLGISYFFSLVFSYIYSFRRYPFFLTLILFFCILQFAFYLGLLESLVKYREGFDSINAGSNLGIYFSSNFLFLPSFLQSFIYQVFGFYFNSWSAIFVFMFESLAFIIAFLYLILNRAYSDKFVDYLIVFFTIYSFFWVLGNDNLGTAMRLRIFNYIVIYIACFIVYQNKLMVTNENKSERG